MKHCCDISKLFLIRNFDVFITRSVVVGFCRHGMPPPASNDILFPELRRGRDETYRRCELLTLIFDPGGHRDCPSYASWYFVRVPSACKFWWYYDYLFSIYRPLGQHGSNWSRDLVTLTFDLGGRGACGWCGSLSSISIPSLKFVGLAYRKI